ncbi:CdaR family transcriptional regulator [Streptomyces sp. NBC_00687]|uniref:PucR family transcriptional regulator n=1 Tax=Streptomyces sp. NBC_00687 TaxID=2975807 RepID=UPI00224E0BDD|nr:helix-turn-helix domain-containing protein [Streptomyces sp. NBC_00687]MCX4919027.1 helix-turn-helix domain-containing protein [Streptomyces sp. NBC_00687]
MTTSGENSNTWWLARLAPGGDRADDAPASSARTLSEATERLGPQPVAWAVGLGRELADTITAEIPELGGGPDPFETLRMGTESAVLHALLLLTRKEPSAVASDEALLGGREFARRRVGLGSVLRGIRLGHAVLARAVMDACRELAPEDDHAREFRHISEVLFTFVDEFSSRMTAEYLAEHDRWVTSGAAAREETVRLILDGDPVQLEAVTRALGYRLEARHLGVIAWCDPRLGLPSTELQQTAADFLVQHGCPSHLLVPVGRTGLWGWGITTAGRAEPSHEAAWTAPEGIHIACGSPRDGLEGFRRTHREAGHVARLMRMNPRRDGAPMHYRDFDVTALLCSDLTAARRFVQDELGDLAVNSPQGEQLRNTLRQYLSCERSLATAAARLHVARNTVTYRVKRAQELIPHNLSGRLLQIMTALEVAHVLGATALERADKAERAEPARRSANLEHTAENP